jgi:hypothetical protein
MQSAGGLGCTLCLLAHPAGNESSSHIYRGGRLDNKVLGELVGRSGGRWGRHGGTGEKPISQPPFHLIQSQAAGPWLEQPGELKQKHLADNAPASADPYAVYMHMDITLNPVVDHVLWKLSTR